MRMTSAIRPARLVFRLNTKQRGPSIRCTQSLALFLRRLRDHEVLRGHTLTCCPMACQHFMSRCGGQDAAAKLYGHSEGRSPLTFPSFSKNMSLSRMRKNQMHWWTRLQSWQCVAFLRAMVWRPSVAMLRHECKCLKSNQTMAKPVLYWDWGQKWAVLVIHRWCRTVSRTSEAHTRVCSKECLS